MNSVPIRESVPAELKWDLSDIYPDRDAWEQVSCDGGENYFDDIQIATTDIFG